MASSLPGQYTSDAQAPIENALSKSYQFCCVFCAVVWPVGNLVEVSYALVSDPDFSHTGHIVTDHKVVTP